MTDASENYDEILPDGGGTEIPDVALRGISIAQLLKIVFFVQRRCDAQGCIHGWFDTRDGQPLFLGSLNLYNLNASFIRKATQERLCSYVELVSVCAKEQEPEWYVSHWWGEPIVHFVLVLEEFSVRRGGRTVFWVCAYCNNQHALGEEIASDPRDSSFSRALLNTRGTLMILDHDATPFRRTWCTFEISMVFNSDEQQIFDLATFVSQPTIDRSGTSMISQMGSLEFDCCDSFDRHVPQTQELLDFKNFVKHRVPGSVSLISDGCLPVDEELDQEDKILGRTPSKKKAAREKAFPLHVAAAGLELSIEKSDASKEEDKRHILNSIAGIPDLDADFPPTHPAYDKVNAALRARFAVALLRKVIEEEQTVLLEEALDAILRGDSCKRLFFDFEACSDLTGFKFAEVAEHLPPCVESLRFDCDRCDHLDDVALDSLGRAFARVSATEALKELSLSFSGCILFRDTEHLRGFGKGLSQLTSLTDCKITFEDTPLGNDALLACGEALSNLKRLQNLVLSLEACDSASKPHDELGLRTFFDGVGKLSNLSTFTLDLSESNCRGLSPLPLQAEQLPNLKELSLDLANCSGMEDVGLHCLGRGIGMLVSLELLAMTLADCNIGGSGGLSTLGKSLGQLRHIVGFSLDVSGCTALQDHDVSGFGKGLQGASTLKQLQLDFRASGLNDAGLSEFGESLGKLHALTEFTLDATHCRNVSDAALHGLGAGLGELKKLNSLILVFMGCNFGDLGLQALSLGIGKLHSLSAIKLFLFGLFRISNVGNDALNKGLGNLKHLTAVDINLYRTSVGKSSSVDGDSIRSHLQQLSSFQLDMRYCGTTAPSGELSGFGSVLAICRRLRQLHVNLSGCPLVGDTWLTNLGRGLQQLSLTDLSLDVGDCPSVTDLGLRHVGEGLRHSLPAKPESLKLSSLFTGVHPCYQWIEKGSSLLEYLDVCPAPSVRPSEQGKAHEETQNGGSACKHQELFEDVVARRSLVPDPYVDEFSFSVGLFKCKDGILPAKVPCLYHFSDGHFTLSYTERNKPYAKMPDDNTYRQPVREDTHTGLTASLRLNLTSETCFECKPVQRTTERWGIKFSGIALVLHPDGTQCVVYLPGVLTFDPAGITGDPHSSERVGPTCARISSSCTFTQLFVLQHGGTYEDVRSVQDAFSQVVHFFTGRLCLWRWMQHQVEQACIEKREPLPYPVFLQGLVRSGTLNLEHENRSPTQEYLSSYEAGIPVVPQAYLKKVGTKDRGCFGKSCFGGLASMKGSPMQRAVSAFGFDIPTESQLERDEVLEKFMAWDLCDAGHITVAHLRAVILCLDPKFDEDLLDKWLLEDSDGNGRLNIKKLFNDLFDPVES